MLIATLLVLSGAGGAVGPSVPTARPVAAARGAARPDAATSLAAALRRIAATHTIPPFARKYNVACNYCHTTIPRLNGTGYKFRAAGFRMPEDIGKAETAKYDFGDYFSARIQVRFDAQATNQPNGAPLPNIVGGVPGKRTTTAAPSFQEATMYPLSGSWGKYFGSLVELSVSPEDFFEVENAYVRGVFGTETSFFTSRVGIFHPWEGIGASDRPFSNARPLFQTSPLSAGGRGTPYVFQPWGLDEAGLEIGGEFDKLSVRGAVLGGTFMRWEEEANAFIAFPSQTGPWKGANQAVPGLGKPYDYVAHNSPDFSANVTYTLSETGGGVSLLYYHGNVATPTSCTDGTLIGRANGSGETCGVAAQTADAPYGAAGNTDFDFTDATAFRNNFDRVGLYASYPIGSHFVPQGGYQRGKDTNPNGSTFTSTGAFVEGAYLINKYATVGARYDWFRPNTSVAHNQQWAISPYVNIPLQNGLQLIAEYQRRDWSLAPAGAYHRQNDTFQLRIIYIQ